MVMIIGAYISCAKNNITGTNWIQKISFTCVLTKISNPRQVISGPADATLEKHKIQNYSSKVHYEIRAEKTKMVR